MTPRLPGRWRRDGRAGDRPLDLRRIAAGVLAVTVEDLLLVAEDIDAARVPEVQVAGVAVTGAGAERPLLAVAADQDRDVGLPGRTRPGRTRREGRFVQAVVAPLERDLLVVLLGEQQTDELRRLLQAIAALANTGEVPAVGPVLTLEPGGADPQFHASAADVVDAGAYLRQQCRIAVGDAAGESSQPQSLGQHGSRGDQRPDLERRLVLGAGIGGRQKVIREPQTAPTAVLDRPNGGLDLWPR